MIEKRAAFPHYLGYMASLFIGVVGIGLANDLTDKGGWWWLPATAFVLASLAFLEHGIISWHEYKLAPYSFHCEVCHRTPKAACKIVGNKPLFLKDLAEAHMRREHPFHESTVTIAEGLE